MDKHISGKNALVIPNNKDSMLASESALKLSRYLSTGDDISVQIIKKGMKTESVTLPIAALELLIIILSQMSKGHTVTILPIHDELTTQEAADLLNVSRPYLVKLLDEGFIPSRKVGNRRIVRTEDIMQYKLDIDKKREKILNKLANESQKHNMGY